MILSRKIVKHQLLKHSTTRFSRPTMLCQIKLTKIKRINVSIMASGSAFHTAWVRSGG